ncbi:MAG: hypothetical protein MMC33_008617 [Icmadophila ericetorum]|nr:hypothetical protein [Icmadophila ericetorum]
MSPRSVHILEKEEYSIVNSLKTFVENLTGELGHMHWYDTPKQDGIPLQKALKTRGSFVYSFSVPKHKTSATHIECSNSSSSEASISDNHSSSRASNIGLPKQPNGFADGEEDQGFDEDAGSPGAGIALDILPPSGLSGFVLFGVQGSTRLRSVRTRLAQIDVELYKDDDSFFDEMAYHKANPNENLPGTEELPSVTDSDYSLTASRDPPILAAAFNNSFYGCKKACIKSQLDIFCLLHECKGRNHCGKYKVLERLPKRRKKWDVDSDHEKDEAWVLHAVFGVSFIKVLLYHMLILPGPLVFWGLWLMKWPTDWQDASVPFFAVMVLLSLFWVHFVQNVESASGEKRLKNKVR